MAHRTKRPDLKRRHRPLPITRMPGEALGATPLEIAMHRVALLDPHEQLQISGPVLAAFEAFRLGHGSEELWGRLADAMNIGLELAERHQIASDHCATFEAGKAALVAVMERQQRSGSWTLRGAEIGDLELATFVHRVQLQHCSRGELSLAVTRTIARYRGALAGNAAPGTRVMAAAAPLGRAAAANTGATTGAAA